jgi:MFS family permease
MALPWAGNPYLLALLVVLGAVFFNFALSPGMALFMDKTEKFGINPALAFAATNFVWASGYATGSSVSGYLADVGGDTTSYLVLAFICFTTLVLLRRAL